MPKGHKPQTKFFFDGPSFQAILADMQKYASDPTVKLKVKEGHDGKGFVQVCTDTWGGDDVNAAHPCPGSPGCT